MVTAGLTGSPPHTCLPPRHQQRVRANQAVQWPTGWPARCAFSGIRVECSEPQMRSSAEVALVAGSRPVPFRRRRFCQVSPALL